MLSAGTHVFEHAVVAICPDIEAQVRNVGRELNEQRLWRELSICLLSSQVPFGTAVAAATAIESAGILLEPPVMSPCAVASEINRILKTPLNVCGRSRGYRFPRTKSDQLAGTWAAVHAEEGSLHALLAGFDHALDARTWLVDHAPGFGPKQASMFLRNIGWSYDLAILDRHVLNYMATLGLYDEVQRNVSGLPAYCSHERSLRSYADAIGYPVGLLDWAIWIVMRAARDLKLTMVTP